MFERLTENKYDASDLGTAVLFGIAWCGTMGMSSSSGVLQFAQGLGGVVAGVYVIAFVKAVWKRLLRGEGEDS